MSKVITFSTVFPSYHHKNGQPTYFVEKFLASCADCIEGFQIPKELEAYDFHVYYNSIGKHHTIREGNRFKVGKKFSPRIWGNDVNPKTGKVGPYQSKQIIISEDIEIKKVWMFEIRTKDKDDLSGFADILINNEKINAEKLYEVAKNDGLNLDELLKWFKYPKPFKGQIICWNDKINY